MSHTDEAEALTGLAGVRSTGPAPRVGWRALVALAALAVATLLVASGAQSATSVGSDKPDLVTLFPSVPYPTQKTPVYVDAYNEPGTLLYRFDAVLFNKGGTLDVYRDPTTGHDMQAIWAGGVPTVAPDPNAPPPADTPGLTLEDLTARGAQFQYVNGPDHNHFHLKDAASYELVVPGVGALPAAKVGFCLGDDWGTPPVAYFPYPYPVPGTSWCAVGHPEATFFREGISSQSGDLYNSQIQYQWVDVTGLLPGSYTLRGLANPHQVIDESDFSNNTTTSARIIPGVIARSLNVRTAAAATLGLKATAVAPAIPARASSNCFPRSGSTACLLTDVGQASLTYRLAGTPCSGRVGLKKAGSGTVAAYHPRAGAGIDGFAYTATDHRGLMSLPAFVRIGHPTPTGAPTACLIGGSVGPDRKARLAFVTSGGVPAGAHWQVFINAKLASASVKSSVATTAPLAPGRTGFWLELVKNGQPLAKRVQSRSIALDVPALTAPTY